MKTLKFYWNVIKIKPWLYFISMFLGVAFQLVILLSGIIVKDIFDSLNGASQLGLNIWILIILYVAIPVLNNIAIQINSYIISTVDLSIKNVLRRRIYHVILKMPGAQGLKGSINESLSRFRDDVDDISRTATEPIYAVPTIIFSIFAIGIMMRINVFLTIVAVIPMLLVVVMVRALQREIEKLRKSSRESTGDITHFIGEIFNSVHSIKVFGCENNLISRLEKLCDIRKKNSVKDLTLNGFFDAVFLNLVYFALGIVLVFAANMFKSGEFTVGDFAIFEYYFWFIRMLPSHIGKLIKQYKQSIVSINRVESLIEGRSLNTLVESKEWNIPNIKAIKAKDYSMSNIEIRNLNYIYKSTNRGVKNINLNIERKSINVISGKTGSGKTTLLRAILGLVNIESGEYYLNGVKLNSNENIFKPPFCSYTPQIPKLFTDTIRNNILMGIDESKVDMEKILYLSALDVDINKFENGLDTIIGNKGSKISGGQQKRIALARMLAINPEIIVIDDFSSSLDVLTEQLIFERLIKPREYTCILVSNRAGIIQNSDNNIVLEDGIIVQDRFNINTNKNSDNSYIIY